MNGSLSRRSFVRSAGALAASVIVGCDRALTAPELAPSLATDQPAAEQFVVAGQSNARGLFVQPNVAEHATLESLLFRAEPLVWGPLVDHTTYADEYPGLGSLWPLFSTRHMRARELPTALITTPLDGTGLIDTSREQGTAWAAGNYGSLRFIDAVNLAGGDGPLRVLWWQGESEATRNRVAGFESAYFDALLAMRESWEAGTGRPVTVVVGQTGNIYNDELPLRADNMNGVRRVQARLWETPGFLPGPVTCDIDHSADNRTHFTDPRHAVILARRWWHHANTGWFGAAGGRGPRLAAASRVGLSSADISLQVDNGGLVLGRAPAVGWRMVDAGGRLGIRRVQLDGAIVRLTADRRIVGPLTISWGYYNDASGATTQDARGLPVEPFEALVA